MELLSLLSLVSLPCGQVLVSQQVLMSSCFPFFQIRMQAQGSLFQGGMIGSFIDIYQQEGTRGLWRVSTNS